MGPNGAGKSTLVNLITGFDAPTEGRILLGSVDVTGWSPRRLASAGMSRTFQHGHSFPMLSARENVEVAALGVRINPTAARTQTDEIIELLDLGDWEDTLAGTLSHGLERLVGVGRALATQPSFLLLDEPAAGLNEVEGELFASVLERIRAERNLGIILIDHNVPLMMRCSDRVHVLSQGTTIAEGTPDGIRTHPVVVEAYLGVT